MTELTVTVTGRIRACCEMEDTDLIRWLALLEPTEHGVLLACRLNPQHFPEYDTPEALQGELLRLVDAVPLFFGEVVTLVAGTEYLAQLEPGADHVTWCRTYQEEGIGV